MSITGGGLLEEKLQQILKTENEELLRGFVHNTLRGHRSQGLAFFQHAIESIQGKQRFKILEMLMEDAGKDLVPLMMFAIKQEKNVLYAKSLLFLYGNFEHAEALEALVEIESNVHVDLQKTFLKVSGKLKARFREIFYISEFRSGDKNAKRMSHAADMMVREPHEAYPPFLDGVLRTGPLQLRKAACRVLADIGGEDSLETLTNAMPGFFHDRSRTQGLGLYLCNESTYNNPKLAEVLGTIGMLAEWEDDEVQSLVLEVRSGVTFGALAKMKATILPDETLMTQDIYRFLDGFLAGGAPPKSEVKRLERLFGEHIEAQAGLLQDAFKAMGSIGHRLEIPGLLATIEALMPVDTPDAQELSAAFLGGYQSPESMGKLLDLLQPGQNLGLVNKVMSALDHYHLDHLPQALVRLASSSEDGLQRQSAMNMIARSGFFDEVIDDLLGHSSLIVQVDAIQTVAAFQLPGGYERLLNLLPTDINPRLQEVLITALEAFPNERTGLAVRPFMNLPHSYLIRFAALKSMLVAGGNGRISMVVETLSNYPEKQRPEMLSSFLKLLSADVPNEIFRFTDLWRALLDDERYANLRPQAFSILEKLDWSSVDGAQWIALLTRMIEKPEAQRSSQENKSLRIYALRVRALLEQERTDDSEAEHKRAVSLESLVEHIESANLHEKVRLYRLMNLHFKADWYRAGEPASEKLVQLLGAILSDQMEQPDLFKIVFSLVNKLNLPPLLELAKTRIDNLEPELAEYGRKLFHLEERPKGRPVQKILILDDTVLIGKTLQRFLAKSGFEVHAETHPEQAMTLLASEQFDLLLVDVLMPGLNGFQFIIETRRRGQAPTHVLMMTSSRERELLQQAAQVGIDGMLLKPFPTQDLLDKIQLLRCL